MPTPDQQKTLYYLVQEYIEGQTLDKELKNGRQYSQTEVIDIFKSLLGIISYTHQQGVLHRDIKPGNIIRRHNDQKLYLIDFDGAKIKRQLEPGIPVEQSLAMGTRGYAPLEQLNERDIDYSADLYAIAATCVHLITGMNPQDILQRSRSSELSRVWRRYTPTGNVDNLLAKTLDRMLLNEPARRYKSAQEIINILSRFKWYHLIIRRLINVFMSLRLPRFTSLPWLRRYKDLMIAVCAVLAITIYHHVSPDPCSQYSCDTSNSLSLGEKVLIKTDKSSSQKKQAAEAFRNDKYRLAITKLQEHLNLNDDENNNRIRNDPEALIYLNNAIAALTKNPVKIAASVPIDFNTESEIGKELLRGIAHAQSQYNCGIDKILDSIKNADTIPNCGNNKKPLLQVQIADETADNKPNVKEVANLLVKDTSILAVIGHVSSTNTAAAADIYDKQLVLISPTSTVVRKNEKLNLKDYSYLFRTSPTDHTAATDLINYIKKEIPQRKDLKIAVIGDKTDYSRAFRGVFKEILKDQEAIGQITEECEVSTDSAKCSDSNNPYIKDFIETQEAGGADMILLALDFDTLKRAATEVLRTLSTSKIKMLGIDGVYNLDLINALDNGEIKLQKQQLVVAVPWHRSKENENESQFEKDAERLWEGAAINWRTAMSFNATQAIVSGLKNLNPDNITREKLYEALKNKFRYERGATGRLIYFCEDGDRKLEKGIGVLVEVVQNPNSSGQKSNFSLLDTPERDDFDCKKQ